MTRCEWKRKRAFWDRFRRNDSGFALNVKSHRKASIWYREPMVWLVIMIPFSAVIMGGILLTLAVLSDDGLVTDDYYKKGLQINRTLERDALAASYEIAGEIMLGAPGEVVEVSLAGNAQFQAPEIVHLRLFHATRSGLDRDLQLRRVAAGRYVASGPRLEPGAWHVQLDADGWRLKARLSASDVPQRVTLGSTGSPAQ